MRFVIFCKVKVKIERFVYVFLRICDLVEDDNSYILVDIFVYVNVVIFEWLYIEKMIYLGRVLKF